MKVFEFLGTLLLGGAIGAGVTYVVCKKKFQAEADKQIASVKESLREYYETKAASGKSSKPTDVQQSNPEVHAEPSGNDVFEPAVVKDEPMLEDNAPKMPVDRVVLPTDPDYVFPDYEDITNPPQIISNSECGTIAIFDVLDWVMFADGTICIDNIGRTRLDPARVEELTFPGFRDYMGWEEGRPNELYIRNYAEATDISIVKDDSTYGNWLLANDYASRYEEERENGYLK